MKKLLGISLVAALAVSPLMAKAEVGVTPVTSGSTPVRMETQPTTSEAQAAVSASGSAYYDLAKEGANDSNLATASYVKGAYNASIKAINKVAQDAQSATQTLTNKTIDADDNTISNLEVDNLKEGVLVDSTGIAQSAEAASETKLMSEKAVMTAVEAVSQEMTDDFATKAGVTTTVTDAFANAKVVAMNTWGSENTTNLAANLVFDSNDPAYTAYHTTAIQQQGAGNNSGSGEQGAGNGGEQSGGNGGGE